MAIPDTNGVFIHKGYNCSTIMVPSAQSIPMSTTDTTNVKEAIDDINEVVDTFRPSERVTDQTPYLFRASHFGGDRETDKLVGGTVAFNQLASIRSSDSSTVRYDVTFTDNRDGSFILNGTANANGNIDCINTIPIKNGHKYLIYVDGVDICMTDSQSYSTTNGNRILICTSDATRTFNFYIKNGQVFDNVTVKPMIFDITAFFGSSTIADYVYSLDFWVTIIV